MASSPGFLAKMAQLVRQTTGASAADQDSQDSQDSQQPPHNEFSQSDLRARIEGKRRDDQVRRREFDHLRKIRASTGHGAMALMASTSTFQVSSGFNPEDLSTADRAHTLKKIDAIEAFMGEQLRQKRQAAQPGQSIPPARPMAKLPARALPVLNQPVSGPLRTTVPDAPAAAADSTTGDSEMDLDFTGMANQPATSAMPLQPEPVASNSISGYSESRLESQELGAGSDDAALQDAAIRFAEGDIAGAEAALLAVLQDDNTDAAIADRCACAMMGLYRATDQSTAFDVVAIEYAERFNRSAPEWYSIPDLLRSSGLGHVTDLPTSAAWNCPTLLTAQGVADLAATQQGTTRCLQWGPLQALAPDAVPALTRLLTRWAEQPVALEFAGAPALDAVLQAATVVGERQTDPAWWLLRLEVLRITGAHEAFETVALDYCITYDVSPPSWMEAVCTCSLARPGGADTAAAALGPDSVPPSFVETRWPEGPELRGNLLGDAQPVLDRLLARGHIVGEPLVIQCARLLRVDFSAVGSMLNWLALRRNEGIEVQFVQVPRLVGAFFLLMGVSEHASVAITTR